MVLSSEVSQHLKTVVITNLPSIRMSRVSPGSKSSRRFSCSKVFLFRLDISVIVPTAKRQLSDAFAADLDAGQQFAATAREILDTQVLAKPIPNLVLPD